MSETCYICKKPLGLGLCTREMIDKNGKKVERLVCGKACQQKKLTTWGGDKK